MSATEQLVVLSNRGPVNFARDHEGRLQTKRAAGGLVVTLGPGVERDGALWFGAATTADEHEIALAGPVHHEKMRFQALAITPGDYSAYYDVISNQTLWFCLHGLWDLPRHPHFDAKWWAAWERFKAVNEMFAAAADRAAGHGATVLVQDYHLALVPGLLAEKRPDLKTAVFLHTPWCSPQEFSVLPDQVGRAILSGLSGGGPCGFNSRRWATAFATCCEEFLGRSVNTFVAPAATDAVELQAVARSEVCQAEFERLRAETGDRRLIVRVDRIEPSKNVLRGFLAFDELLESRPDLRGEIVFAAMVYPSRLGLGEYQLYGQEVQASAAWLNEKWGRPGWSPVLLDPEDAYPRSVAALRLFDVLLVNPIRDGLNLVAKEGALVNERDGVVVLSRQAGAWDEVGDGAVGVNPFDVSATAAAISQSLDMAPTERATRLATMRSASARTPLDWFDDLIENAAPPK